MSSIIRWRNGLMAVSVMTMSPVSRVEVQNLKILKTGSPARYYMNLTSDCLQAYLNEFTFRFNRRFYPFNAFRSLLGTTARAV